jgi:hypothetical protein
MYKQHYKCKRCGETLQDYNGEWNMITGLYVVKVEPCQKCVSECNELKDACQSVARSLKDIKRCATLDGCFYVLNEVIKKYSK